MASDGDGSGRQLDFMEAQRLSTEEETAMGAAVLKSLRVSCL